MIDFYKLEFLELYQQIPKDYYIILKAVAK